MYFFLNKKENEKCSITKLFDWFTLPFKIRERKTKKSTILKKKNLRNFLIKFYEEINCYKVSKMTLKIMQNFSAVSLQAWFMHDVLNVGTILLNNYL